MGQLDNDATGEPERTDHGPSGVARLDEGRPAGAPTGYARGHLELPELLAPAGTRECIDAAVENGADAVYFGLNSGFNARARAENLSLDELPELMAVLHRRGVRGYATLNTLVFTSELDEFERQVIHLAKANVDAVLVQDLGAARLIGAICPELEIHASTQMTLTSAEGIAVAERLGVRRVVLARELSLREIARIRRQTDVSLEVFVHGALCVAYSGQCLTSESLGGRSANRGQCAQACRLPYELFCDGREVDLGAQRYLLSPQDLAAYELIPELMRIGVKSLKIEGRLKSPEYVANITQHYRSAIDRVAAGEAVRWTADVRERMELSFSRGLSPGWLEGCDHKRLVPATSSAKRGVLLGRLERVERWRLQIRLKSTLRRGDGIVVQGDRVAGTEQGGRVYQLWKQGREVSEAAPGDVVWVALEHGKLDTSVLAPELNVWKTDDPRLARELRSTFTNRWPRRRVPIAIQVIARSGEPLRMIASDPAGHCIEVKSDAPLAEARRHPLCRSTLLEQLDRFGHTAYCLAQLDAVIERAPMVPLSVLGRLRRRLIEQLDAVRSQPCQRNIRSGVYVSLTNREAAGLRSASSGDPPVARDGDTRGQLHVLCRSLADLESLTSFPADSLLIDFADIRQYERAVEMARDKVREVWVATPRIFKPGERGILRRIERSGATGILARNLAAINYFVQRNSRVVADYSLNAANELTIAWLLELGVERVTASYDLNREQLYQLVDSAAVDRLEVVVHQHMPMFHMEHCVFCSMLSPGTNKTNCGRPCDLHRVELRDRVGMMHPLHADVGCRNTLFNQVAQSGAELVPTLQQRGVRHFRIELLPSNSSGSSAAVTGNDSLHRVVNLYRQLLLGERTGREVWQQLKAANRVGVTRGSLEQRRDPLAIL